MFSRIYTVAFTVLYSTRASQPRFAFPMCRASTWRFIKYSDERGGHFQSCCGDWEGGEGNGDFGWIRDEEGGENALVGVFTKEEGGR